MKEVSTTTTLTAGVEYDFMLKPCGDYRQKFQNQAIKLLFNADVPPVWEPNAWADIMHDENGGVFAVYRSKEEGCPTKLMTTQLNREDCPEAFEAVDKYLKEKSKELKKFIAKLRTMKL